ncbi:ABC transporter permease [Alteribacillus sp. HJP-4]|uniref:ABC transporter permease n=1 Tax=Alteribacillus sp. HJP-4 TaxID=2775394 RepID=UPI0035CD03A1
MKSAVKVGKELYQHLYLINRLALYELKIKNKNNYLGNAWELITPCFFIAIYWFVFGYGIRGGGRGVEGVEGVPFLNWMTAGIILWFFFQPAVIDGSKAIYTKVKMVSKMNFPTTVIPTYIVISKLYAHLALIFIVMIYMQATGYSINIYYLQFPYLLAATIALLVSIVMITSTATVLIRDIQLLIRSTIRVMLYLTPFLWTNDRLPEIVQDIMKLNPLYYLVEGYRAAYFGDGWYLLQNLNYTIYFWSVVLIFFIFGSILHMRFRRHFLDFL